MNLYEISTRFQQLMDKEELSAEESAEMDGLFTNAEDACIEKAKYIRNLEAQVSSINAAIGEMKIRANMLSERQESERIKLLTEMQKCNLTRITKSPLFSINIPKARSSVQLDDDFVQYGNYLITTIPDPVIRADKMLIKKELESGVVIEGAKLIYNSTIVFK